MNTYFFSGRSGLTIDQVMEMVVSRVKSRLEHDDWRLSGIYADVHVEKERRQYVYDPARYINKQSRLMLPIEALAYTEDEQLRADLVTLHTAVKATYDNFNS